MIWHLVLFKLKPGYHWDLPEVRAAEKLQERLGEEVAELRLWRCGRNVSERAFACDYAVLGLLDDEDALARYQSHPFHTKVATVWTAISDRVVADVRDDLGATAPSPPGPTKGE
jgi:hypothetical protein